MNIMPQVTLRGRPTVLPWMSQEEKRFRAELPAFLGSPAGAQLLHVAEGPMHVDFETNGESDCVTAFLAIGQRQYFLKAARAAGILRAECHFLNMWSELVRTPRIEKFISLSNPFCAEFLLMERIQAINATDVLRGRRASLLHRQMGWTLSRMHKVKAHGFGRPQFTGAGASGVHPTFREEICSDMERRVQLIGTGEQEKRVLQRRIDAAIEVVTCDISEAQSALTHCDMKWGNLLISEDGTLAVIDPNCRITHPGMCLAACLFHCCSMDEIGAVAAEAVLDEYQTQSPIASETLEACLFLRSLFTLATWIRKGKHRETERLIRFLGSRGMRIPR